MCTHIFPVYREKDNFLHSEGTDVLSSLGFKPKAAVVFSVPFTTHQWFHTVFIVKTEYLGDIWVPNLTSVVVVALSRIMAI